MVGMAPRVVQRGGFNVRAGPAGGVGIAGRSLCQGEEAFGGGRIIVHGQFVAGERQLEAAVHECFGGSDLGVAEDLVEIAHGQTDEHADDGEDDENFEQSERAARVTE